MPMKNHLKRAKSKSKNFNKKSKNGGEVLSNYRENAINIKRVVTIYEWSAIDTNKE